MMRLLRPIALTPVLALVLSSCTEEVAPDAAIAQAREHSWSVEAAASLMATSADLPADPSVVRGLTDLWIDYILLADAAQEDSTLSNVDVSPLVNDLEGDQLILALRDSVITVDPLPEDELRRRYQEEAPNSLARARQIVLAWPANATPAQRDSVRAEMAALRPTVLASVEAFGSVARARSQDQGTADQGGQMPIFGHGDVLPVIEEAAFSLGPGEVSQPLESPLGVHLVRLDQRLTPDLQQFEAALTFRRTAEAEIAFLAEREEAARPELVGDAYARIRALGRDIRKPLPEREVNRPLMRYVGGVVTQGEFLWYLQAQAPQLRARVASAQDDTAPAEVLRRLLQRKLLILSARGQGWSAPPGRLNEAAAVARANLAVAARQLGLLPIVAAEGETPGEAVERAVNTLLSDIITGKRREVTPLSAMSHILRMQHPPELFEENIERVVERMAAIRSAGPTP